MISPIRWRHGRGYRWELKQLHKRLLRRSSTWELYRRDRPMIRGGILFSLTLLVAACAEPLMAQDPAFSSLLKLAKECRNWSCVESFAQHAGYVLNDQGSHWYKKSEHRSEAGESLLFNSFYYSETDSGYMFLLITPDKAYTNRLYAGLTQAGYVTLNGPGDTEDFTETLESRSYPEQQLTRFMATRTNYGQKEQVWGFSFFVKR